jgi:hypothetical protein
VLACAITCRLKWMTRPLSLIDLMALVPFYLELSMEFEYVELWCHRS